MRRLTARQITARQRRDKDRQTRIKTNLTNALVAYVASQMGKTATTDSVAMVVACINLRQLMQPAPRRAK
jgi:hypothetical protein